MNTDFNKGMNDPRPQIELPARTVWPIVLAFGFTLVFAGLVTAVTVSLLGAVLVVAGSVGWFREVLPVESHEWMPVTQETVRIERAHETVERIMGTSSLPRAWLPVEIYPVTAGIKGGLAGGAVMAVLAGIYGLVSSNGIWYATNLLVAGFFPTMAMQTASQIGAFNIRCLMIAIPMHLLISLLVGLLYGAMLPMLPKSPILLGGFVVPLMWSGLIYGMLAFVNPVMNQHIDWLWFVLCQVAFGVVAGLVVTVQERIPTRRNVPLIVRLGIEAPGLMEERQEGLKR